MAQRKVTGDKRVALSQELRSAIDAGTIRSGDMLPTVRQLALAHDLSIRAVAQEVQKLVDEGVLHTVPRVGTFVGRPHADSGGFFLLLTATPDMAFGTSPHINYLRMGFEERIAQLGASSLVLPIDTALRYREEGRLPSCSGVFDFAWNPHTKVTWPVDMDIPYLLFGTAAEIVADRTSCDYIDFDDVDGGYRATQYLMQRGHRRIGFLGLHQANAPARGYQWSNRRQDGWQQALSRGGVDSEGLLFLPTREPVDCVEEGALAAEAARRIVMSPDITAVVAANDLAVLGLFQALRESHVDPEIWPAVIGFDDLPEVQEVVLSSLRLPWEEIGRVGADFLWERSSGRLTGAPQEYLVKMRLISRLTSRRGWSAHADTHNFPQLQQRVAVTA